MELDAQKRMRADGPPLGAEEQQVLKMLVPNAQTGGLIGKQGSVRLCSL